MVIRGTMGMCEGSTMSAMYGPNQYVEFVNDANDLGFRVDVTAAYESTATAYDANNKITGEWSSKTGGQIAWSV